MIERYRPLSPFWRGIVIALCLVGVVLTVNQLFALRLFGLVIMDSSYLYLTLALFLSPCFLFFPLKKGAPHRVFFWFDVFLFLLSLGIFLFLAQHGWDIMWQGWSYFAPPHITLLAVLMWALVLEAVRRTIGLSLALIILSFSLYPLLAPHLPGILEGYGRSFTVTANFHSLSVESVLGIPLKVFASLLIGFMIFGIALQASGGGKFFLDLAFSLLGRTRGGPAKVAVMASAMFGSISGSAISNVITTGSVTIPTMKRTGYPSHYAGAIEAVASTGGVLMPPVMGATAFVMAAFLGRPYADIVIAAAIPSVLYYLGLLVQVDGFAARTGISGLPRSEIPPLIKTLKEGWFYLFALVVLVYFLFSLRVEAKAPFYATAVLLILAMLRKETRFNLQGFLTLIESVGRFLAELVAILAGVGMILGSLALTGVAAAFARELVVLAGGNVFFMLILGALASLILGIGMTITAVYVFLAIVLAPPLIAAGFNPLAVHLFVMYTGMLSFITPPVALATFPAATIAQTSPLKVGLTACRLAVVIYIVPFLFVYDPALVAQAGAGQVILAFSSAALGVLLIASSLEGYLIGIGKLGLGAPGGYLLRAALFAAGVLLAIPGWRSDLLGLALALLILLAFRLLRLAQKT